MIYYWKFIALHRWSVDFPARDLTWPEGNQNFSEKEIESNFNHSYSDFFDRIVAQSIEFSLSQIKSVHSWKIAWKKSDHELRKNQLRLFFMFDLCKNPWLQMSLVKFVVKTVNVEIPIEIWVRFIGNGIKISKYR